jgi:hypothetical protein
MRKGALTLLLALAASAPMAASAAAAPLPGDFFGVSSPDLIGNSPAVRAPILADERAAGVRLLRQLFDWSAIEPSDGSFNWAATDSFMASAAAYGMQVLPVMLYSPTWASSCPGSATPARCPPADATDFGNFVAAAVARYGPNGSFWQANPSVPKLPISSWQLWNEPSIPAYWGGSGGTPNPAEYVALLRTAAPIIRAADPHAELVAAGIPDSSLPGAIPMSAYVSGMYAAGFKGLVDALAVHLYDDTPSNAVGLVEQTRATMNANGDSATPIWASEFGWASAGSPNKFVTDLAGEAANLSALMGELVARHEELGIRGLVEYDWHDASDQSNTADVWDNHLGLVFDDYTHKPAYDAFRALAIHTQPPDTSIVSAPTGAVVAGPQTVSFTATEAGSDFKCLLDDSPWADCTSPLPLAALAPGPHRLSIRATDPYGNPDPTPVTASWRVAAPPPKPRVALGASVKTLARRLRGLDLGRLAQRRKLSLALSWPAAGRLSVSLRGRGILIAHGSRLLRRRGSAALALTLSKRGRRLLAQSRELAIVAGEQFRPTSGAPASSGHARVTLKRR